MIRESMMATTPPETFDALRQRIRDRFTDLSPHLQRIARTSLDNPNGFALNTTSVIAAELDIQPSTLIRFAKEFGYQGFSDLQKIFRQRLIEGQAAVRQQVFERDQSHPTADTRAILNASIEAHKTAIAQLAVDCDIAQLNAAIQMMNSANHIYIAGLRRSRSIAEYLQYCLIRAERSASMLDFAGGMAGPQVSTIRTNDILFAIAFPPYSKPVVDVVLDAHVSGKHIICLTDSKESPLAMKAEVALLLGQDAASRLQPISSAIVLVQTLVTALTHQL